MTHATPDPQPAEPPERPIDPATPPPDFPAPADPSQPDPAPDPGTGPPSPAQPEADRTQRLGCLIITVVLVLFSLGVAQMIRSDGWWDGLVAPGIGLIVLIVGTILLRRLFGGHGCIAFIFALTIAGAITHGLQLIGPRAAFHHCVDQRMDSAQMDRTSAEIACD